MRTKKTPPRRSAEPRRSPHRVLIDRAVWRLLQRYARAIHAGASARNGVRMTASKLLEAIATDFCVTHCEEILEDCADAETERAFECLIERFGPNELRLLGIDPSDSVQRSHVRGSGS